MVSFNKVLKYVFYILNYEFYLLVVAFSIFNMAEYGVSLLSSWLKFSRPCNRPRLSIYLGILQTFIFLFYLQVQSFRLYITQ